MCCGKYVQAASKAKTKRKDIFKRAEQYVKEYREQVGVFITMGFLGDGVHVHSCGPVYMERRY
jgi:hypothetical protein